jgi:hypothetical protein
MTDNEIVKELEKLIEELDDGYTTCIEHGGKRDLTIERDLSLYCDVLDLINRQKAEIERLNKELETTRAYIHDNGLEYDLLAYKIKQERTGGVGNDE